MKEIVKSVVDVSRYIFERGLVPGKAGNVSARINSEDGFIIAITPTLVSLHDLNDDDIVLVKDNGEISEVNGIVHAHSPYATGFAFSDKKLKRLEGFGAIKSEYVKEVPYEKPGSIELAEKAADALKDEDLVILKNHGVIATGETVEEACGLIEFAEGIAKTQFVTHMLNSI